MPLNLHHWLRPQSPSLHIQSKRMPIDGFQFIGKAFCCFQVEVSQLKRSTKRDEMKIKIDDKQPERAD